jgi:hypothetical protein
MSGSTEDAVAYVDHFWSAMEELVTRGVPVPEVHCRMAE